MSGIFLAIAKNNAAVGTSNFASKAAVRGAVLLSEYFSHIEQTRAKLLGEKRGSKRWWKIASEIMNVLVLLVQSRL